MSSRNDSGATSPRFTWKSGGGPPAGPNGVPQVSLRREREGVNPDFAFFRDSPRVPRVRVILSRPHEPSYLSSADVSALSSSPEPTILGRTCRRVGGIPESFPDWFWPSRICCSGGLSTCAASCIIVDRSFRVHLLFWVACVADGLRGIPGGSGKWELGHCGNACVHQRGDIDTVKS